MKTYSTLDAAKLIGVHRVTLQEWLSAGKVRASQSFDMGGRKYWRWTDADVERVRRYKEKHYREGQGRKRKAKD